VALIITVPTLIVVGWLLREVPRLVRDRSLDGESLLMICVSLGTLTTALFVTGWRWRRRGWMAASETLLVTGYTTNAAMCLLSFHDDPQLGYWLTVPVAASFAAEMLLPQAAVLVNLGEQTSAAMARRSYHC
jgi:hypothetical protein